MSDVVVDEEGTENLDSIMARYSFKRDRMNPAIHAWVRGRRYGRRITAYVMGGDEDPVLTVCWTKQGDVRSMDFVLNDIVVEDLELELLAIIRA